MLPYPLYEACIQVDGKKNKGLFFFCSLLFRAVARDIKMPSSLLMNIPILKLKQAQYISEMTLY